MVSFPDYRGELFLESLVYSSALCCIIVENSLRK